MVSLSPAVQWSQMLAAMLIISLASKNSRTATSKAFWSVIFVWNGDPFCAQRGIAHVSGLLSHLSGLPSGPITPGICAIPIYSDIGPLFCGVVAPFFVKADRPLEGLKLEIFAGWWYPRANTWYHKNGMPRRGGGDENPVIEAMKACRRYAVGSKRPDAPRSSRQRQDYSGI